MALRIGSGNRGTPQWLAPEVFDEIVAACHELGTDRLKPLKDVLRPEITYDQIRLVAAHLRAKANTIKGLSLPGLR